MNRSGRMDTADRIDTARHASVLLEGFGLLMHFLIDAEIDWICQVPAYGRSQQRANYRSGYYHRKLSTPLGEISLRVAHLKYVHPRISLIKRAKRLCMPIMDSLSSIHSSGASADQVGSLIKILWTLDLPESLFSALTSDLVLIMKSWRRASFAHRSDRIAATATANA